MRTLLFDLNRQRVILKSFDGVPEQELDSLGRQGFVRSGLGLKIENRELVSSIGEFDFPEFHRTAKHIA